MTADPDLRQSAGYVGTPATPLARIFQSMEDHLHLIPGDRLLIDAGANRHLQAGDRLRIYRPTTAVRHPHTDQALGAQVMMLGAAQVLHVESATATLQIIQAFDTIMVGDYVMPILATPSPQPSAVVSSSVEPVTGIVVATREDKVAVGLGDIVYLDRGEQHGVAPGDRFDVFEERHDGQATSTAPRRHVPRHPLGVLTVLDVRRATATALVTASQREFSVGASVERLESPSRAAPPATSHMGPELMTQLEAGQARVPLCLDTTLQALRAAEAAGARTDQLMPARQALARAELLLQQARQSVGRSDYEQALRLLEAAQTDCLTAQELSAQALPAAARQAPARPEQHRVQRGETLWGIAAKPLIYANPLMWPLIYRANRQQLHDPDVLKPQQVLTIPRHLTAEHVRTAIRHAQQRGRWRLHDGPDAAILKEMR